jgi:hypothetical protein
MAYVKTKQDIAATKNRMKMLLDVSDFSELSSQNLEEAEENDMEIKRVKIADDTEGSSAEAKNKRRINSIIV